MLQKKSMRNPKALVIRFKFREGYPNEIIAEQVKSAEKLLSEMDLDYDITSEVVWDRDADKVTRDYNATHYDFVILLVPTWLEPPLAIRATKPFFSKPLIVWGFGTFEKDGWRVNMGAMPGSGVIKGALREMGADPVYVYGLPASRKKADEIKGKIQKTANVARAISLMDGAKILSVGYLFGGMYEGDIDISSMRMKFGPQLNTIDSYTLITELEKIDTHTAEFKENRAFVENHLDQPTGDQIDPIVKMYMVLARYIAEQDLAAISIKCHFELSQEYGLTACIPLSVLGNYVVAVCEADMPVLLTEMVMHYLSGGVAATYADVHDLVETKALVAACGMCPSDMCIGNKAIAELPDPNAEGLGATFAGYITNKNYIKPGKVTFARILKEPGATYSLHYTTGTASGDVGKVKELDCPQYPFTEIDLDTDLDAFAQKMGSHHYALIHGDMRKELELFCRFRSIRAIR